MLPLWFWSLVEVATNLLLLLEVFLLTFMAAQGWYASHIPFLIPKKIDFLTL